MNHAPIPPANLDAEEHVLCAMMTSTNAIETVRPILRPGDFSRTSHGNTYRAILDLAEMGIVEDIAAVASELHRRDQLEGEYTKAHVIAIGNLWLPTTTVAFHAQKVLEAARFRALIILGEDIRQLGWDQNNAETAAARARELVQGFDERTTGRQLPVETWHEFESQAHHDIPVLVNGLWPETALGFIAAAPKKGKTWVALALAIAVATGRPFLNQDVPEPRVVLYVALEGHRAALRARVGAIARGMGINPDTDELENLRFIYKPRGLNLQDPVWAQKLRQSTNSINAALCIIDVLRAGARIKENDQAEFTHLAHNLQPITQDGCSLGILHHFTKLSEISKERAPGERMSGTGAMFGALDVGIYITGSQNDARELRLEFDTRDLAGPQKMSVHLAGEGTGPNGGFTYLDTAAFEQIEDEIGDESQQIVTAGEIADYIHANGGDVEAKEARAHFDISADTLSRRIAKLRTLGIEYSGGRGSKPARLTADAPNVNPQPISATLFPHAAIPDLADIKPHSQADPAPIAANAATPPLRNSESGDLQGKGIAANAAPLRGVRTRAHTREAHPQPHRLTEQHAWIDTEGHHEPDLAEVLTVRWPNLTAGDITDLTQYAARLLERGTSDPSKTKET
jgi:hypothetical protein